MTDPDKDLAAKLVRNEQAKLAATFFNNIAVAFVVAGVIVPLIATVYGTSVPVGRFWIAYTLLWCALAYGNHRLARRHLKGLKP